MHPELEKIYETHKPSLQKFVFSILKDENITNDVMQDLYIKLYKQDFDKIKTHTTQWLFTVSRNLSIKIYNKRKRFVELNEDLDSRVCEDPLPFDKIEQSEKFNQIKKILSKLSDRHKKIIKYRYYDNLSYEKIAKKMKITQGNVGFILHMAVNKIRAEFTKINMNNEYV